MAHTPSPILGGAVGGAEVAAPPSLTRWVGLCAAAEGIGMTAAAAAAKGSQVLVGEPSGGWQVAFVLALVVAGGLVEGLALGVAQSVGLSSWLPRRRRTAWVLVTLAVAGVGWAAASAPAVLSAGAAGDEPALPVVLAGAAGLGVVMGGVLGSVQALVLRGVVRHPWRWVPANVAAWAVAMPLVFVGATSAGAAWSFLSVVAWGTLTGVVAGAALGLVTGAFLVWLKGSPARARDAVSAPS